MLESNASYNTQYKEKNTSQWHNTISTSVNSVVTHLQSDMENDQISVGSGPRDRKGSASAI